MTAPLTLRLFGPMRVEVGGEPLPRMRSRKGKWLLALLALRNGEPVSRDWLAANLWPDTPREVALANLRPLVSELRKALGGFGESLRTSGRSEVVLDIGNAEIDILEFDRAIDRGDHRRALEWYRGPFLEDCAEPWAARERDFREVACLDVLERLGQEVADKGDFAQAAGFAQRAVSIAPWRDAPRRRLMALLAKSGDVNAALQVYREFAQLLRSERASAPDAATTELFAPCAPRSANRRSNRRLRKRLRRFGAICPTR